MVVARGWRQRDGELVFIGYKVSVACEDGKVLEMDDGDRLYNNVNVPNAAELYTLLNG